MGKTSRKKYTPEFKTQVAIEALKGRLDEVSYAEWLRFFMVLKARGTIDRKPKGLGQ